MKILKRRYLMMYCFWMTFLVSSEPSVAQFERNNISFLALGDSYTIGHSVSETERWPNQLGAELKAKGKQVDTVVIRATTGWTTSVLLSSLATNPIEKKYNLVSLLIGVNNYYQGKPESIYLQEFPQLLDSAIYYCGGDTSGVFVVSIPDYGYTPFGQSNQASISQLTDRYNFIADSICKIYAIPFYNITAISRRGIDEPDLVAYDNLHPSGKQYTEWVDLMLSGSNPTHSEIVSGSSFFKTYFDLEKGWIVVSEKAFEITSVDSMGVKKETQMMSLGQALHLGHQTIGFYYKGEQGDALGFYRLGK